MGKKRSVALIVLMSVVLAGLLFISVTPAFFVNDTQRFTSLLSIVDLGSDLGTSYTAVYYPEGVITKEEYDALEAAYQEGQSTETTKDDISDPSEQYARHAGVYITRDYLNDEDDTVTDSFQQEFDAAVRALEARFGAKDLPDYSVQVQDDYSIRVTLPDISGQENMTELFERMAYSGSLFFSDTDSSTASKNVVLRGDADHISGAGVVYMGEDTGYGIAIDFTADGQEAFADATTELTSSEDSSSGSTSSTNITLYVYMGQDVLLQMTVSGPTDQPTIYISGGFDTFSEAETIVGVINSAIDEDTAFDLRLDGSTVYTVSPSMGDNAALIAAVAFGVLSLAMIVFALVRYKGMGLAHMFAYLGFAVAMILCISLIEGIVINIAGVLAIVFSAALLCGFNAYAFSNIRAEFATGKTLSASIKAGYKKSLALTIDVHIVLFVIAALLYFIATGTLYYMSVVLMLGIVFSAACTLGVTRFCLYVLLAQPKNKIAFCNLKREEVEEDE